MTWTTSKTRWRPLAAVALLSLALAGAAAAPAQAAGTTYTQTDLTVQVSGTSVVAKTTVKANPATWARYYGVCVRDSADRNLDFPKVQATISTAGTPYTSPAVTFTPGTYTAFPCVFDGTWHNVGAVKTFTVGALPAPTLTATPVGDDTVRVTWSKVDGATGYLVARDGTDTGGTGPWSTTDPASATSRDFLHLRKGDTYTFTVQALPNGARRTVTAVAGGSPTPTPSPTVPSGTQVSLGTVTSSSVEVKWTKVDGSTGYLVGRNGTDDGGSGPWSTTDPASATSRTFLHLLPGTTYTFTVTPQPGGTARSVTATTSGTGSTPTPTPTPTPTDPGTGNGDWLSGTATSEQGNTDPAKYFGDWRGSKVEIGETWVNTSDVWGINPSVANSWANFTGPMSVSYSVSGWKGWRAMADGANDAEIAAAARNAAKFRAGKGTTFVSPFYEYNGDWMTWSVTRSTQGYADFQAGWARMAAIWKREFPAVKIVLPAACGRDVPAAMLPDKSTFDMMGCTIYNAWPWDADGHTAIAKLEAARQQAESLGKPLGITEWANAANGSEAGGGGDAAKFITNMHAWMVKNGGTGAGDLVFETFFNIDGYALDHMLLKPNGQVSTTQPQTAAKYRELF